MVVRTGLSVLPVLLGGWGQQPFKHRERHCAALAWGRCCLAAREGRDALQVCPAKGMELDTKERGSLGQQGRRRAKEDIYFFDILLFAASEKIVHESPSATLVQLGLRHSVHEGEADSSQPV